MTYNHLLKKTAVLKFWIVDVASARDVAADVDLLGKVDIARKSLIYNHLLKKTAVLRFWIVDVAPDIEEVDVKVSANVDVAGMLTQCCTVVACWNENPPQRLQTVMLRDSERAGFADNRGTPG